VSEIPLPRPKSDFVDSGKANLRLPGKRRARRKMFRRLNTCSVPGYAPLCMDTNDPDTVECAFRQRLLRDVPLAKPGVLVRFRAFVKKFCRHNLPHVDVLPFEGTPASPGWLDGTGFNEERKAQLREAYQSLRGGRPTKRQASHIDSFVKSEFYPTWKHCRMINSRADVFKAWSGPRFKAIENAVYALPEFIKHVPVPDRPAKVAAMKKAGRRYFATDFTAYESHFTPEFLDACECELYRWCLWADPDVDFLCDTLCGDNRMRTRTGISAWVRGRRMSGDMCTSLGNGFANLMLCKFLVSEKGGHVEGFVEGDDGLFATNVNLTANDYEDLGFTIKIEEVTDPCAASFCGMIFSESGEIIREPRRFMMGFGWTQSFITAGPKIMDELLRAKALSAAYETPNCPITGAFARYALLKTRGVRARYVADGWKDGYEYECRGHDELNVPEFHPSADTRVLYEHVYGVSVACQLEAEAAVMRGDFACVARLLPPTVDQRMYSERYVVAA
jgi:hypothetical protein